MSTSDDWDPEEISSELYLDNVYDKIPPNSYIAIQMPHKDPLIKICTSVDILPLTRYGISAKTTKLSLLSQGLLPQEWFTGKIGMDVIRNTIVFAQSETEPLVLSEEPLKDSIKGCKIELDGLYDGIQSGSWIIVSGERDIPSTNGIQSSELVMVSCVENSPDQKLPKDTVHTILHLASSPDGSEKGLAYSYKRETVIIYANVVKATNGETRTEVLGSGDARKVNQEFALRQSPLTYVSAPTKDGTKSTLEVRVNDILWHETDNLNDLGANDRYYVTKIDDSGKTSVIFGDGQSGARLPTGVENVKAVYRTGIGTPGNVDAGQIKVLATKPLGVKGVINPIQASGGADRETRDQARRHAPLATMALDRLLSVPDYENFTRTFAGIGKASARMMTDGRRQVLHLTIAGLDDIPIDKTSDLFQNLIKALQQYGDPYLPVQVDVSEKLLISISALVHVLPDYKWEFIEPHIRAELLDTLGFDRRKLGQNVYLSEVISVIQNITGVDYVEIESFKLLKSYEILKKLDKSLSESQKNGLSYEFLNVQSSERLNNKLPTYLPVKLARIKPNRSENIFCLTNICPAQIAYLTPDVPDTLILKELKA